MLKTTSFNPSLPNGWAFAKISELCQLNPKHKKSLDDLLDVSFVPMASVSDTLGCIKKTETRKLGEVRKSYSHFSNGDVILAKITPCMENGKAASVKELVNGLACGSTEFFVLRSHGAIDQDYLYNFIRQESFRRAARATMQSGVGQARVPKEFIEQTVLPLPPLAEQHRIVAKIESLQERSRKAREALSEVGPLLEQFRQSLLAAAFRGDLTADWRDANPDVEPASQLLERIRQERREKWEQAELSKYEAKGKTPPKDWRDKFGSGNTKANRAAIAEIRAEDVAIDSIPDRWEMVRLGDVSILQAGYAFKSKWFSDNGVRLLRGTNIEPGRTRWKDTVHLPTKDATRFDEYKLNDGDIVIAMDRPVVSAGLKIARITNDDLPALLLQRVGRFQVESAIFPDYLYLFLQSSHFLMHIGVQATGTQLPHVSSNDIESAIIPLPPIEEQIEISSQVTRALVSISAFETLLERSSFDFIQLDQSILAKAFRGELVPQDPNDEPASVLLERIQAAREELAKSTKKVAKARTSKRVKSS